MTTPSDPYYPENQDNAETSKTKICHYPTCPSGKTPQPIDNFYKSKKGLHKRQGWCKVCSSAHSKLPSKKSRSNGTEKPEFKVCTRGDCPHNGALQPISNFHKDSNVINGISAACKTCNNRDQKKWFDEHPEFNKKRCGDYYENNVRHSKEYAHKIGVNAEQKGKRLWTKNQWIISTLARCRQRAAKKGFSCDIDASDLLPLPEFCSVFGVRLDYNAGPEKRVHAAVDKIIPALGYVKGNVRIISNAANWAKLDGIGDIVTVRRRVKKEAPPEQPYLFSDFKRFYEAAD